MKHPKSDPEARLPLAELDLALKAATQPAMFVERPCLVPKDVFLSHSKFDVKPVRALKNQLEALDMSVYLDEDDPLLDRKDRAILVGSLMRNLSRSRLLLVFLSEKSCNSRWVPWELGISHGRVGRALIYPHKVDIDALLEQQEYLSLYTILDPRNAAQQILEHVRKARSESVHPAAVDNAQDVGLATYQAGIEPAQFQDPAVAYEWMFRGPLQLWNAWLQGVLGLHR
jgi:hypothetical protein